MSEQDRHQFDRLAQRLNAAHVEQRLLLETIAGLHPGPEADPAGGLMEYDLESLLQAVSGDEPVPIGIWTPQQQQGETLFVRDEQALTRHWWPPHPRLRGKQSLLPLRVCLLGESTSAGWFYAPGVTPAKVLQGQLDSLRGDQLFEVLDLSMVNLQPQALVELCVAATQLSPDILVIFAGNNWASRSPVFPDIRAADIRAAAEALRKQGVAGLSRLARERSQGNAERTVAALAGIADAFGISLVLVTPEVNLRDWRRARPPAWLPGDGSARWHTLHRQVTGALAAQDFALAERLSGELMELDGGEAPASLELAAEAQLGLGGTGRARELLQQAVEARTWDNFPSVPSATLGVQGALRGAADLGLHLIDLPQVFREVSPEGLPDRRWFLDYCHLTLEGMRHAMAAVAHKVLQLTGPAASPVPGRAQIAQAFSPLAAPAEDAQVKFMSLLYGAHYGCDYDPYSGESVRREGSVSAHWLAEARRADPAIDTLLLTYAQARTAPFQSFDLSGEQQDLHGALTELERQTSQAESLDADVVRLILDTLGATHASECAAIMASLLENHAVERRPTDLCHPAHHWSLAERQQEGGGYGTGVRALLRARWPCSHFCFVSEACRVLRLQVTARLPLLRGERAADLELLVNGNQLGRMRLETRWTQGVFDLPVDLLVAGYNKLTLEWPPLPAEGDIALQTIVERLETGIPVDLHPLFGELYALRIAGV